MDFHCHIAYVRTHLHFTQVSTLEVHVSTVEVGNVWKAAGKRESYSLPYNASILFRYINYATMEMYHF